MVKMEEVINEIKKFAQEFKSKNGNAKLPPNKDMNLWMIKWMVEQDRRITKVETTQKILLCFIPVFVFLLNIII